MSLLDQLSKPSDKTRHSLCVVLGDYGDAIILFAGDAVMDNYLREGGQLASDNGLDDPPSDGIWIWEGVFADGGYNSYTGDYGDVELRGQFRRPTKYELTRIGEGVTPFEGGPKLVDKDGFRLCNQCVIDPDPRGWTACHSCRELNE